ncbi:MAG: V-type ATPase 116kDa subunit family protein [Candidatus Omnitrophota bacterium]
MEKITILIFHKAKEDFLHSLQELGVIHISQDIKKDSHEGLKEIRNRIDRADAFLKAAKKSSSAVSSSVRGEGQSALSVIGEHENIQQIINVSQDELDKVDRQIRNLAPWGEFSRESMEKVRLSGLRLRFFITPVKNFDFCGVDENICAFEISRDKTYVYFVVFEKEDVVKLNCDEFFYPDLDLKTLQNKAQAITETIRESEKKLSALFSQGSAIETYLNEQKSGLNYATVNSNLTSAAEDTIYIINGWLPQDLKLKVQAWLDEKDIYCYFSKPNVGEDVPILLKNNPFAKLFEPITKMFSLPNYTEFDLTAFFAPFFTLFFGFCLGDAGYGLIILLLCAIFWKKVSQNKRPLLILGAVFGVSTFLFGLISGNLFGVELVKIAFIKNLVLFNQNQLFYLSLKIGVVQIFFGLFLKAFSKLRQFGFTASLSSWGWLIMLTGVLPLVLAFLSDAAAPLWALWTSFTGLTLIMLFNDLKANIFIRLGKGLWELYGGLSGFLGDVLSYVRLFALGLSGAVLGLVVNEIGMQFRAIPFVGYFITFVFLIVGHSANLLLSGLSSFVHPLRLTFVEFYKNVGFEGGGKAYNPFKKIN